MSWFSSVTIASDPSSAAGGAAAISRAAPGANGENFFKIDDSLQGLLKLYLPDDLREHMTPHYNRLGEIAGNRLDELARTADKHAPVLHARDPFGRDED